MSPKVELVREWLTLADDDLRMAELTMKDPEPICWAAAFHCQQAAEKSLKAFLAYHDHHVEKTHDIEFLLGLSKGFLPEMEGFIEKGGILTDYAVDSRYPAPRVEVTQQQAREAIERARSIYEFILNALADLTEDR